MTNVLPPTLLAILTRLVYHGILDILRCDGAIPFIKWGGKVLQRQWLSKS